MQHDVTPPFSPQRMPQDILQLAAAINALPDVHREHLGPFLDRVLHASARRRQILFELRDALAQVRLDTKYLMFDLEATRRERDQNSQPPRT